MITKTLIWGREVQTTGMTVKRLGKVKGSYFQKQTKEDYENEILMV